MSEDEKTCNHENFEVVDGAYEKVSKSELWMLFELNECKDCEHQWLSPYMSLPDIDPIPDDFSLTKDGEDILIIVPSKDYLINVIKIPEHNLVIPKE